MNGGEISKCQADPVPLIWVETKDLTSENRLVRPQVVQSGDTPADETMPIKMPAQTLAANPDTTNSNM